MTASVEEIEKSAEWLLEEADAAMSVRGFTKTRSTGPDIHIFGNIIREYKKGNVTIELVRERGEWWVSRISPGEASSGVLPFKAILDDKDLALLNKHIEELTR